jgi:hypothetical protein
MLSGRLLASIYGRPPTISRASDVQLPSEIDREVTVEGPDSGSSTELIPAARTFCLSIKLLNIFHEILEAVYLGSQLARPSRSRSQDAELLGKILNLNHQLDQFLTTLPKRLGRFINNSPSTSCDQTCNFDLHEQALVTRFVPLSLPEALFCLSSQSRKC